MSAHVTDAAIEDGKAAFKKAGTKRSSRSMLPNLRSKTIESSQLSTFANKQVDKSAAKGVTISPKEPEKVGAGDNSNRNRTPA